MTHDEKINIIKNLIKNRQSKFLTVEFVKKDGSIRKMMCARSKLLEASVKGTQPEATAARQATLKARNMLCVEELVKPGTSEYQWRTVNCETVRKISADGKVYDFA